MVKTNSFDFAHFHLRYGISSHGIRGISNRVILNGGLTPIHDRRISKSDFRINAISGENGKKDAITPTFSLGEGSVSYIFSLILKDELGFDNTLLSFITFWLNVLAWFVFCSYCYFVNRVIPLMIQITESMKYIVQQRMLIDPMTFPARKSWSILSSCGCIL